MNAAEVIDAVEAITKRPDKRAEIIVAMNHALSHCTLRADFARDLVESTIATESPTSYTGTISLASLTRFRKIKYLKATGALRLLHEVDATKMISAGKVQPDTFYIAGNNLVYSLSSASATLEIGYYAYPALLGYSVTDYHWMLDLMPYCIIDFAAARIFNIIGDDISYRLFQQQANTYFDTMRNDAYTSVLAEAR